MFSSYKFGCDDDDDEDTKLQIHQNKYTGTHFPLLSANVGRRQLLRGPTSESTLLSNYGAKVEPRSKGATRNISKTNSTNNNIIITSVLILMAIIDSNYLPCHIQLITVHWQMRRWMAMSCGPASRCPLSEARQTTDTVEPEGAEFLGEAETTFE